MRKHIFNSVGLSAQVRGSGQLFHGRFQEQAARWPDCIAVVYEDRQLTYHDLEGRANQLARYLQRLGVGPDRTVAVCVERSPDLIVALLGVLKAGGAYLPLDPALSSERIGAILADSRTQVLLTHDHLAVDPPEQSGRVVCLDTEWHVIAKESRESVRSNVTARNLAYVLFTSESAERPRGVAVEHRQLVHYLDGIVERLDLPMGASFAFASTFAEDFGNAAIFPALCTGGCLHVISHERASDPEAFTDYFVRHSIDFLKIVPSHLQTLVSSSRPEYVLPKRGLVLSGEAVTWDLIEKLELLAPECVILNHYGQTETASVVTTYRLDRGGTDRRSISVPIGKPMANAKVHLLNSCLQPVPTWAPGEIYVGGPGLARGYLNRPDLTAERFIPNPLDGDPGTRLYGTGDLGRYLPDGNIEFLGRVT